MTQEEVHIIYSGLRISPVGPGVNGSYFDKDEFSILNSIDNPDYRIVHGAVYRYHKYLGIELPRKHHGGAIKGPTHNLAKNKKK